MEIEVVDVEAATVVGIPHKGDYQKIGEKFQELHKWQTANASDLSGSLVAIYYDDPHHVAPEQLRSFAGMIIDGSVAGGGVEEIQIPGGKYAKATFIGDYSKLGGAWEEFFGSIFGGGLKTKAELCFEKYFNTPMDTAPEQLKTELYAPLA